MTLFRKLWENFKSQPDLWFFQCFLFSFPLSIRKVLYYYPIRGQFNEYTGIYLYLSDIFLVLAILTWLYTALQHKNSILSIYRAYPSLKKFTIGFILLVLWSFISISWATNIPIAIFRSVKIFEWFLLLNYIIQIVPRGTIYKYLFKPIIIVGLIESMIGILQIIFQHSLGLVWIRESVIASDIPGVAKIVFAGEKYIRAYGTFPHPNILGGFLMFSLLITFLYTKQKLFHVEQLNNTPSSSDQCCAKIVPRGTITTLHKITNTEKWLILSISFQIIALLLTFSKAAIGGLALGMVIVFYKAMARYLIAYTKRYKIVPRGTILSFTKLFTPKKIIITLLALLLITTLSRLDFRSLIAQPIAERGFYINVSRGTILHNSLFGLGMGQFVLNISKYSTESIEIWQFQPVHNVFLLLWCELGIIGLGIFIWLIWQLFHVEQFTHATKKLHAHSLQIVPRGTIYSPVLKVALIGQIFIALFDHYQWDIQQGQIIFWILISLAITSAQKK